VRERRNRKEGKGEREGGNEGGVYEEEIEGRKTKKKYCSEGAQLFPVLCQEEPFPGTFLRIGLCPVMNNVLNNILW
jgi:hypothetical protein